MTLDRVLEFAPRAERRSRAAERPVDIAVGSLEDGKAEDIVVIDLRGKSIIADHMIVATGRSGRQVAALAENLTPRLKAAGVERVRVEGLQTAEWVLIDAGDLIVHLFRPEVRDFYQIEKMWQVDTTPSSPRAITRI